MKSIRFTLLSSLALALLGPCLAQAQGLTGEFTLPMEARWGTATLQPGIYSFRIQHAPQGVLELYSGHKTVAFIYAQAADEKKSGRNTLTVVQDKYAATIREMSLPVAGMVLFYAPSSPKHGGAIEERGPGQASVLAVTISGK